jgi:DNA repair exonuclease SbcCD ATPase subunit
MSLFANLSMDQKKKLNELIEAINEKDELLDSQEDFLIKENKKFVKMKNAYAQEVKKCENLSKELSICHDSIFSLRNENASLFSKVKDLNVCNDSISCLRDENARLKSKIEELNECKPSTSTIDHVSICIRCRYINIEAIDGHLAMIKQQNDHISKLTAKIAEHELENEKFKFARSMLYNGRRPGIKDGIVSNRGAM